MFGRLLRNGTVRRAQNVNRMRLRAADASHEAHGRGVNTKTPQQHHDHHDHHDHHHHDHHAYGVEPSGYFLNLKPGERYTLEGWEIPFYFGMWGSLIAFGVALKFLPDSRLETWAKKETEKRMRESGAKF